MRSAGQMGGQYKPLTQDQVETIHGAALDILEQVGFTYESGLDETLAMLRETGCDHDPDRRRIFFPRELVLEQAAKAPSRVVLCGRKKDADLDLSTDRVHLGTGGSALNILDLESGWVRKSVLRDIYQIGRLVDKLDNIHFYLRPCIPHDIPETAYDVNSLYACLRSNGQSTPWWASPTRRESGTGPKWPPSWPGGLDRLQERPFISAIALRFAISPLKLCTQSTLNMQEACRLKIPVALSVAPMAGSTSPLTMAGTLAQLHAEELAGLTIGQLTNPGAPLLYGGIPGMADLRSMGYSGGAVEFGMMNAAIHQLARPRGGAQTTTPPGLSRLQAARRPGRLGKGLHHPAGGPGRLQLRPPRRRKCWSPCSAWPTSSTSWTTRSSARPARSWRESPWTRSTWPWRPSPGWGRGETTYDGPPHPQAYALRVLRRQRGLGPQPADQLGKGREPGRQGEDPGDRPQDSGPSPRSPT